MYDIMKINLNLRGFLPVLVIGCMVFHACSDDTEEEVISGMTTPKLGAVVMDESTLTHNTVTLSAELLDWGGAEANSSGICWGTVANPSVESPTKEKISMNEPGVYKIVIKELLPETQYYVRSWARNTRGLVYSDQFTFTTKAESPEMMDYVEVGEPQLIDEPGKVAANLKSEIISNGGGTLKRAGFVVSENSQPTIEDKVYEVSNPKIGNFELSVTSLLSGTTYYVRTFGENAKGIVYSDTELTFSTQEADMSLKANCGKSLLIGGTAEVPLYTSDCLSDKAEKIIEREYNVLQIPCCPSAWNSWETQEIMNLDAQRQYVDWCHERNIKTIGHFMLGTNSAYYPEWFNAKAWTKEELETELENRIKTVIEKMGGDKVDMWTVVNEAIDKGNYVVCKWSALGTEAPLVSGSKTEIPVYISKAFEYAHKYAPSAELILSERTFIMSMQTDKTCVAFRQLAEHLKAKGLISTVGLQLHQVQAQGGFDNPEGMAGWNQLPNHVKWFKDKGFKVLINEVTISKSKKESDPPFTAADLEKQKRAYKKFVATAVDAGVDGILFWGLGDGWNTYRPYDEAQLYNHNRDRKPAFDGVLEALMERFPSEQ